MSLILSDLGADVTVWSPAIPRSAYRGRRRRRMQVIEFVGVCDGNGEVAQEKMS
jgi:hypothetical protein